MSQKHKHPRRSRMGALKSKIARNKIPLTLVAACIAVASLNRDLATLLVFAMALGIYTWRRYDSRMFVGTAISLLVACAVLLALGDEYHANQVAVWAYYSLATGVLGLLIEYVREERRRRKRNQPKPSHS